MSACWPECPKDRHAMSDVGANMLVTSDMFATVMRHDSNVNHNHNVKWQCNGMQ
jgi:hypothetical protein